MNLKEAIKASLDGKVVETFYDSEWISITSKGLMYRFLNHATLLDPNKYRIQPKPDYVKYRLCRRALGSSEVSSWWDYDTKRIGYANADQFKITYDGETNQIKSVEVVL